MLLYRPVGLNELRLIYSSLWRAQGDAYQVDLRAFPPRDWMLDGIRQSWARGSRGGLPLGAKEGSAHERR